MKADQKDVYQTGRLRRSTLVSLRWLAVFGQLMALGLVKYGFEFDLPLFPCLITISLSAFLNIVIMFKAPLDRRIESVEVGVQLLFDILQLTTLLYLTGGMENPFIVLLLAPAVVAAKTLNKTVFISLACVVSVLSFAMLFNHYPLPWIDGQDFHLPQIYQYGAWLALLVGMLFTSGYTWRATAQTRRMTRALAATEAILFHEKKLSALGGLAAAAAHELGTPLATIQITAKEIARDAKHDSELHEDANLVISQAQRCRDILQNLANHGEQGDEIHDNLSLPTLLQEITQPFIGKDITINTDLTPLSPDLEIPTLARHPEFVYGLTNIVENAVGFAAHEVRVICTWDEKNIAIEILDDGPGFHVSILPKIGEPYISLRPRNMENAGGLGLGLFIAKTLIERVGGTVKFGNRPDCSGARVLLCWPYIKI